MAAAAAALTALGLEVSAVTAHVHQLLRGVREAPSSQGLSFLHLKNQQLAMYLSDLTHLILGKVTAGSICDHPARLRLVELRTVLEKMRPIEHKLRYQIDKLVKTAITGTLGEEHPLAFKPNPGNLISKLEEDEEEEGEDPGEKRPLKQSSRPPRNVYIPPRLIPMHYGGEESVGERSRRAGERMRRRALGSSLVRELHEEFSEAPREETQRNHVHGGGKLEKQRAHRVQYEESMMVRLSVPRGERRSRGSHSLAMTSQLRSLTHFSSITALTGDMDPAPVQKKRKVTAQTKRRKGFRRH